MHGTSCAVLSEDCPQVVGLFELSSETALLRTGIATTANRAFRICKGGLKEYKYGMARRS
jgi:hypothetical protein